MEKDTITSIVTVLLALIGVAILAEIISNKAQTGKVLTTGGGAFTKMLCTALSPVFNCGGLTEQVTSTVTF